MNKVSRKDLYSMANKTGYKIEEDKEFLKGISIFNLDRLNTIDTPVITDMNVARDLIMEGLQLVNKYYIIF